STLNWLHNHSIWLRVRLGGSCESYSLKRFQAGYALLGWLVQHCLVLCGYVCPTRRQKGNRKTGKAVLLLAERPGSGRVPMQHRAQLATVAYRAEIRRGHSQPDSATAEQNPLFGFAGNWRRGQGDPQRHFRRERTDGQGAEPDLQRNGADDYWFLPDMVGVLHVACFARNWRRLSTGKNGDRIPPHLQGRNG